MSLEAVRAGITVLAQQVADIKQVYDWPVTELGRELPALAILYTGFDQKPGPGKAGDVAWQFEFTLYLPLDGRSMKEPWRQCEDLAEKVLAKFKEDPGLDGSCWLANIDSGAPIIEIPNDPAAKPRFIGHSFRLTARTEET